MFVVKTDQSVDLRAVKVARNYDGLALIEEGLTEGERVVTGGQLRLTPGARIEERSLEDAVKPQQPQNAAQH